MYIMYIFFWYSCTHTISVRNDRISATPEVKIGKILIDQVGKDRWGTLSESLGDVERWSGLKTFFFFFFSKMMSLINFGWSLKLRKQQESRNRELQKLVPDSTWKKQVGRVMHLVRSGIFKVALSVFSVLAYFFFQTLSNQLFWSPFRIFPHMRLSQIFPISNP